MKRLVSVRLLGLLGLFLLPQGVVPAENRLGLPDTLTQGGLYVGRVAPGSRLWQNTQEIKITPQGYFVFGVKARETAMVGFRLQKPGGQMIYQRFMVRKYPYDVQRIDGLPPKMVTPPPAVLTRIRADAARVKAARRLISDRQDFRTPFIWPVKGRISGQFGNMRILNGKPKSPHSGMDIAAPRGTPVLAPLSGVVTMTSDLYYTGHTVIIDHGFGVSTVFAHMDRIMVKKGQMVKQGEAIGTVGATGRATGPHLHWGLNWQEIRLNPALVLDKE